MCNFSEGRTHIQLRELPRSALLTDLRRLCIRNQLLGVTDGKLRYLLNATYMTQFILCR